MKKYFSIFKISLKQEFTYRLNFIMWRVRNIMQILVFFFLWSSVFNDNSVNYFGYTKEKIITYAFLLIFVRSVALSARSVDIAGQIANGELSNYLLRPINYFKYWLARDLSSKILNIFFSIAEISILVIFLRPTIFIQTSPLYILLFIISLIFAAFIFGCILMLTNFITFWIPELSWGAQFLVLIIFVEFLSGAFFPLDVFPKAVYNFLKFTPFPYLIFIPIKSYLGTESINVILQNLGISFVWSLILLKVVKKVWKKGLLVYEGVGK